MISWYYIFRKNKVMRKTVVIFNFNFPHTILLPRKYAIVKWLYYWHVICHKIISGERKENIFSIFIILKNEWRKFKIQTMTHEREKNSFIFTCLLTKNVSGFGKVSIYVFDRSFSIMNYEARNEYWSHIWEYAMHINHRNKMKL